eukprot:5416670-Pleurochrysis_carterae.AAC.1
MIIRLKVLRRYPKAWQAQIPNITIPLSTAEPRHRLCCSERARRLRSKAGRACARGPVATMYVRRPGRLLKTPSSLLSVDE